MIEVTVRYSEYVVQERVNEPTVQGDVFIQKKTLVEANTKDEALNILRNQFGNDATFIFKKN